MIAVLATTLWCVGSSLLLAQSTTGGSYGLKKPSPWKRFTTGVSSTFQRGVDATTNLFTRDANPEPRWRATT